MAQNGKFIGNGHSHPYHVTPLREESPPPTSIPPNDYLEQLVLGALLLNSSLLEIIEALEAKHFARDLHRKIFTALRQCFYTYKVKPAAKILMSMIDDDHLDIEYLRELNSSAVSDGPVAVTDWAEQLIELDKSRRMLEIANDMPRIYEKDGRDYGERNQAVWEEFEQIRQENTQPLPALDYNTLPDQAKPREWLIDNWLPMYETTGLGGAGGEGKTLLAHMLATATVLGKNWLGMPCRQMKAAMVLCEDRPDDAQLRQIDINKHYDCRMKDLDGLLMTIPMRPPTGGQVNQHHYLAIFDRDGNMQITPFFNKLLNDFKEFGARLVILDNRAELFRGNQNDEAQARSFVCQVADRFASELKGLVILIFHPSMYGIKEGTGTSGSVQWDAAYRARLYLAMPPKPKDENEEQDEDVRRLTLLKTNYSKKGPFVDIKWDRGVFIRVFKNASQQSPEDRIAEDLNQAMADFLNMLDRFTADRRAVSSNPKSGDFAPRIFARTLSAASATDKQLRAAQQRLDRAMAILFKRQSIRDQEYDPDNRGRSRTRIVRVV